MGGRFHPHLRSLEILPLLRNIDIQWEISHTFFLRVLVLLFSNNNFVPGVKTNRRTCGGSFGIVHKDHSGLANISPASGDR